MGNRFIFSDPHFGHDGIYRMVDIDGRRIRGWAETAQEGDEIMVAAWNRVVHRKDKVIVMGDVAIKRSALQILGRLNGDKVLVRGNHDIFKLKDYLPWFSDILGTHKRGPVLLSHYPVHPDSIPAWCIGNIHGHTHVNHVLRTSAQGIIEPDPRYLNACVEVRGVVPVPFETLVSELQARHALVQEANDAA